MTARRLAAALGLAVAGIVHAQPAIVLDPARQPVPLGEQAEFFIDQRGDLPVARVTADADIAWQPTRQGATYALSPDTALWLRFNVAPRDDAERWYLEVPYPAVDRVTLYTRDRAGQWIAQSAGDTLPTASWPLPHRYPLLPMAMGEGAEQQFLVRVENPHSFSAPLGFTSERALVLQEQRTSLILGIYFGLASLALVLAILGAVSLRDSGFARYALAVSVMGLAQASFTGVAGLHLWPQAGWWNDVSALVLPALAAGTLMWFLSSVISLQQRSRLLNVVMLGTAALGVPVACALLVVDPRWRFALLGPYVLLGALVALVIVTWSWRRGDRHAGWLLAGLAPVVAASLLPLARTAGLIPLTPWSTHAMQVGIAIELPLLLMVLMMRSQHRRENSRRIQGLDRIDPATGLINAVVFRERLAQLLERSNRLKYESVVLMVEIANVQQIARDFGQAEAQEIPLRVASRLLSVTREIDVAARLSEFRFAVLVEGPVNSKDAADCGPMVVARCLMPFKGKPVDCVAQVRVAQTLVPNGSTPDELIDRLQSVLASVPADSKRAVFTIR